MYDKQIEKVQHLLDNVKRSSAMKYRLNLRKLIDEMKNRAVVALQIKETKRTHVLHAFKVKEELIKQNYKVLILNYNLLIYLLLNINVFLFLFSIICINIVNFYTNFKINYFKYKTYNVFLISALCRCCIWKYS